MDSEAKKDILEEIALQNEIIKDAKKDIYEANQRLKILRSKLKQG